MPHRGKKYREAEKLVQRNTLYDTKEAVALIKKTSTTSFDATIEIHVTTTANVKHADQVVRSTTTLPAGTGKTKRIAVFADGGQEAEAKKAGADVVGGEDLIEKVLKGEIDFDIAIATPKMMRSLAKAARILGPKGLMPSPKSGTVTDNISAAIEELKQGKIEFRTDKNGIIHSIIGKVSFSEKDILENLQTIMKAIVQNKPSGVKGVFLKSISLSSTMGPGISVSPSDLLWK
ncbi:50S ribosomal protein L1 [Candidatus Peregrinibacteria bacterium]|nr:MAG: 50S ribosomal protein L1 [Candidatus Peregrinibacteria bacterium]